MRPPRAPEHRILQRLPWVALLCLLAGVAAGCTPSPNMRGPQKLEDRYEELLGKWTRSDAIYHREDRILVVHATYLAPELREALREQYLKIFSIDPGRVDTDLEKITTLPGGSHEFFVFADMTSFTWNNLEDKASVWRLGLFGGWEQPGTPPRSIVGFQGRGPNLRAFFPYLNDFGRSYLVTFPEAQPSGQPVLEPGVAELTLKLASAYGTANLAWKVTP